MKTQKVLLYEPGKTGHRPVILRYLEQGLPSLGWEPVVVRDPAYARLRDCDLAALEEEARRQRCSVLHLLTIDGCVRNWLRPRRGFGVRRVPILGTYYLFNNLWGWRGLVWQLALWFGYVDRILVSDPYLVDRWIVAGVRSRVGFIPDPWCRKEFPYVDQAEARARLKLPQSKKLILVFGEISQRKGVGRILKALCLLPDPDICVIFAGTVCADSRADLEWAKSDAHCASRFIVHDWPIVETDVSAYFYAADAILMDYPKTFGVSSGTYTRSLVSGRVAVLPKHGVNFEVAYAIKSGVFYKSESIRLLAKALSGLRRHDDLLEHRGREQADFRELSFYLAKVCSHYEALQR